ncbi:vWA domain-containing protein [Gloeothece verrucosa]|uniref:von Willebrand factor type A n=1 Tax=Gloeothece verrucosa (strain PCC 7822) TaxID=497965 RepID=E0UMI9_GLOV7|nr:VWA domain-containing protein [Gloeothece verrucosa]ADN18169.1 von Willebrand factor type A [Gloeothece verrucosa PCC 7822]
MLNVSITPHREFFPADTADQRLFIMLKLRPTKEVSNSRPSTSFAFVIDTSGSMDEVVTGGKSKKSIVIESLYQLVRSGRLTQDDHIAIIEFHDQASTLIGLTPATQVFQLENAIARLNDFSGGTCMGKGMNEALVLLTNQSMTSRRVLIFTDGETFDEEDCEIIAQQFSNQGISITAMGVGDEFNEDLLIHKISDPTGGRLYPLVIGNATGLQVSITELPKILFEEHQQAKDEVINNLTLSVKTVKGVELIRVTRVYPDQAEFPLIQQPYFIGAAKANDETIFILEFSVDSRATSRVRIAQLGLTYDIPGLNKRGEFPPQNVVAQFVGGQGGAAQVNQEVMGYVQQRNISQLVNDATRVAENNPEQAEKLLETARRMTVKIGNKAMEESLNEGIDELRKTKKISAGTRKTVKMGSKGKTVKMGADINDELSDEQIRQISGT